MRMGELGEFGMIERLKRLLPAQPVDVVLGIGDDVAVLRTPGGDCLLATCDIQVENIHFRTAEITAHQLGRRLAAVNLSDIAAMGGSPLWALASLALPQATPVAFVEDLFRGLTEELGAAQAVLVGGNLSRIEAVLVIDLFVIGRVAEKALMRRSGARPGDLLLVTGTLGDSRAGLELLQHHAWRVSAAARQRVVNAHQTPAARLREGRALGESGGVRAMLDVSDGLLADCAHLCEASGVGAEIVVERLPVSPACREVAAAAGVDPGDWALAGGEDYELLFASAPESEAAIHRALQRAGGVPARVIGRVLPREERIRVRWPDGTVRPAAGHVGWDHFRGEREA
jgi:thiamine-monophosphate kinase